MESNADIVPVCILEKLILLYGFGKELYFKSCSNKEPLSETVWENYYLINGEWINKYKEFYNYSQITDLMVKYDYNYQTYKQYKNNMNQILNKTKSFFICRKGSSFSEELKKGNIIFSPDFQTGGNNIKYIKDCYIVDYDLYELLSKDDENQINSNDSITINIPYKICISQDIYIIHGKNIEIGQLNSNGMFIPKYYIKPEKENPEEDIINIIKCGGIEKYININYIDTKRCLSKYNDKGGLIFNIELFKCENSKEENVKGETGPETKDNISHYVINEKNCNNINEYNNQISDKFLYIYQIYNYIVNL